jgi:hypothetical protein
MMPREGVKSGGEERVKKKKKKKNKNEKQLKGAV